MNVNKRLAYPDICKFIAIFIVTCSHCAQIVSKQTWSNFIGGSGIDIAFNMPLFMIISGWFINLDKLREANFLNYIFLKFKRLILPAVSWQIVYLGLFSSFSLDALSAPWFYWYLVALFFCLCIIIGFAKIIKNDWLCIFLSVVFVILFPLSSFVHINFMFPFLWAGYLLRKILEQNYSKYCVIFFCLLGFFLSIFWKVEYTVYLAPFKLLQLDSDMVFAFLYRFIIGFCLSATIIYVVKISEKTFPMRWMADYGKYTLLIYTFSAIVNGGYIRLLNAINYTTNEYILIDVLAIFMSSIVCFASIALYKQLKKSNVLSMIFLGE